MSRIPVSYPLLSRQIRVEFGHTKAYGEWSYENGVVTVSIASSDGLAWETFCHELTHSILETAGYDELSQDEALVERVGGLLAQALDGFVYADKEA